VSRPSTPYGTCRACGATVLWADLPDGKRPVDPDPAPDGLVVLYQRHDGTLRGEYLYDGAAPPPGTKRRSSHFSTCPAKAR
jgi:hypothetical protein